MERNLRNDQSGCSVTISQTGLRYRTQQPRRVYLFRTISHNDRTVYYRTGNVLCRLRQYFSSVFRQTVNHYGRILSGKGHTSYSHVGVYPIRHCSYLSGILPRLYRTERHCIIDHRRLEIYRRTSRKRI